jgi:hypothetical protein
LPYLFCNYKLKFHKIANYFSLKRDRKKIELIDKEYGFRIWDREETYPGSRGQKSTGFQIRNTACNHSEDTSATYTFDGEKKHNVTQIPSLTPIAKKNISL